MDNGLVTLVIGILALMGTSLFVLLLILFKLMDILTFLRAVVKEEDDDESTDFG